jgi:putative N6-adenine-specific DNA methylase
MSELELIATAGFGLEAVVARELKALGYADQQVEDGRVTFIGDEQAICRTNLRLRSAERVLLKIGSFEARDFGELFDRTIELPWAEWTDVDAAFPVRGKSVRSQLHSVPDCQRIVKKAVVESLKRIDGREWFEENGPAYGIEVSMLKDQATLTIDTSGSGLHKRGYRTLSGAAPLKETLAAALVQLSFWNPERTLVDPFCGTGTIPIEAALIARNIAPGLNRVFAAEEWPRVPPQLWDEARSEARDEERERPDIPIIATDLDEEVLSLARYHARRAGVEADIHFQQKPIAEFTTQRKYGCIICNPPYGERSGSLEQAEETYREMTRSFKDLDTWSLYVLTSHPEFERLFGRRAERRRKLYNGRIACTYFQYAGPRPPRRASTETGERPASAG